MTKCFRQISGKLSVELSHVSWGGERFGFVLSQTPISNTTPHADGHWFSHSTQLIPDRNKSTDKQKQLLRCWGIILVDGENWEHQKWLLRVSAITHRVGSRETVCSYGRKNFIYNETGDKHSYKDDKSSVWCVDLLYLHGLLYYLCFEYSYFLTPFLICQCHVQ